MRVAGVRGSPALGKGEAGAIGLQRLQQIALADQHVADVVIGDEEIALRLRVAGVRGRPALGDGEAGAIGFQRLPQIALPGPARRRGRYAPK